MNLKSRPLLSGLWWAVLTALILGLATGESSSSSAIGSESTGERKPRKYLELDDLNALQSADQPLTYSSGEELVERLVVRDGTVRPKRSANATSSQQLQRQRVARQNQKKQRPGFFWTLARVTFETFNDTKSAIQQIGDIINDSLAPEPARKPAKKKPTTTPVKSASLTGGNGTAMTTPEPPTTTTEFKLTRPELQSLVRRNVKGLVRLFNIEWRDAIDQSKVNVQEFHRDLGKQVGMYLQDNPNNY